MPIGEWVLRRACADAAGWPDKLKVAINLSAAQFKSRDLVATVVAALSESGLQPSRLELEVTETAMFHGTDATLATLHRLRELGVRIAMDDFGTGYSSLSYLRRFPFGRNQDRQVLRRRNGQSAGLYGDSGAVTALGIDLGMAITAEGVETQQQLDTLEQTGCTEAQGFLFSPAVPEWQVIGLLKRMSIAEDLWPPPGERIAPGLVRTRETCPPSKTTALPSQVDWSLGVTRLAMEPLGGRCAPASQEGRAGHPLPYRKLPNVDEPLNDHR